MKTMAPQEAAENEWNTKRKRKINQRTPPTTVSSLFLLLLLLLLLLLFLLLRRLGIPFFCHVRRISFLRADRERKRTVTSRSLSTSLSNEASSCQTPPDSTNIADEFIEYRRLLVSCCCFFFRYLSSCYREWCRLGRCRTKPLLARPTIPPTSLTSSSNTDVYWLTVCIFF